MAKKVLAALLMCASFAYTLAAKDTIYPISRENGSGTRGAFVEIFAIQKEVNGKKIDATSKKAEVTNSTGVMMTTVANLEGSIGYISLGSLNNTVKALKIDGVAANVENINNKTYTISRPFHVVTKQLTPASEDFLNFTASKDAVDIIEKAGYIPVAKEEYVSKKPTGKVIIGGSSSITPLIEKLKERYETINPQVKIEVQQSDSTTGVRSVLEGIADIGMVSRDVKKSELEKGITAKVLAIDGLAIIVNKKNPIDTLSKEDVKKIYTDEIRSWSEVR